MRGALRRGWAGPGGGRRCLKGFMFFLKSFLRSSSPEALRLVARLPATCRFCADRAAGFVGVLSLENLK